MSASPLPVIQTVSQAPAASNPVQASTARNSQNGNNAGFDSHLQNAQRQQAQASTDDTQASAATSANQNSSNQSGSNAPNATQANSNTKPGLDPIAPGAAQTGTVDAGSGSLANTVLNLIDQATGDSGSSHAAASGTKSASEKPSTPTANNTQSVPSTVLQPIAVALPPVPPMPVTGKASTDAGTKDGVDAVQTSGTAAGNANPTLGQSIFGSQKPSDGSAGFSGGDAGDSSNGSDATTAGTTGGIAALLQSVGDSTQTLAGASLTGSHVASALDSATAANNNPTQNTSDLSALRGVLDATGLVPPSGTTATTGHNLTLNAPVGSSGFAKELSQQVTWLSGQDVKQAQIRLNPQDLGPLDVKVTVNHGGSVDVAFMTQHPAATAAVQQGLDQLHNMLSNQGLSLGHTTVGQHGAQQQFAGQQGQQSGTPSSGDADNSGENSTASTLTRVAVGLVDAFA